MALTYELISQFAKIVKNDKKQNIGTTIYGTVVTDTNGNKYVKLDGSDQLTPLTDDERPILDSTTANANNGERVSVLIKDHTATVTGNISSPSVRSADFKDLDDSVTDIKQTNILIANEIQANRGYIQQLQADKANIGDLTAATAKITELDAKKASVDDLNAAKAEITDLKTTKLDADVANLKYATIDNLNATNAEIGTLKTEKASIEDLKAINANIESLGTKYANIDFSNIGKAAIEQFYATSGIIKDLVIGDTSVTGKLVGVTITGDLIEGGTVKADKLVVLGTDGLYYKLNTDGVSTTAEQTEYNSLNGSVITAKSITAEKVNVNDLVAFDATIGGFNITDSAIYSGVKESVTNTTCGVYLDKDGQIVIGDGNNFLRYYKDQNDQYKLEISSVNSLDNRVTNCEANIALNAEGLQICVTKNEVEKQISDTSNELKILLDDNVSSLESTIETNKSNVDQDIDETRNIIQNLDTTISKYLTFNSDGLVISSGQNKLKLRLSNDKIEFIQNGVVKGWWDGNDFHTGNIYIDVSERAQFGNFAFVPRSDGSLMFLKVSD